MRSDTFEKEKWARTSLEEVPAEVDKLLIANGDKQVSVIVREARIKPKNPFSIVFHESLSDLIHTGRLGLIEVRVLLSLLKFAAMGNFISINQSEIAKDLQVSRSTVSRAWRVLQKEQILLTNMQGSLLINPQIAARTSLKKLRDQKEYKLSAATRFENF